MTDTLTGHDVEQGTLLPESWSVLPLGDLIESVRESATILAEETYELWSVPSFADGEPEIVAGSSIGSGKLKVEPSDVLISKINPRINRVWIVEESQVGLAQVASTEWLVARIPDGSPLQPDYLQLYATSPDFRALITEGTQGVTGSHTRAKTPQILRFSTPVPPREEQERIVEILEEQLARLDTALQSVHTVREKAAQFRRSLLHAAFTGALTGHDAEDGELPTDWRQVSLVELLADQKYALAIGPFGSNLKRSDYQTSGVPLVFVRNIRANDFDLSPVYVTPAKANDLSAHGVRGGDVLVTKMGDPPGDTTIYPANRPDAVITADCIKVTADPEVVSNRYLSLVIDSPVGATQIRQMTGGVAQQKVNLAKFRKFQIPLAPRREQDQIVEILEDQLSRLDASLAVADAVEERSAALRRSLLHSAFTGRLTEEWREAVNV